MGKKIYIKIIANKDDDIDKLAQAIIKRIKINLPPHPKSRPDLRRGSGKNSLVRDELVSAAYYKVAKLVTMTKSKVYKPKTYNEKINNSIHDDRWHGAINKELVELRHPPNIVLHPVSNSLKSNYL